MPARSDLRSSKTLTEVLARIPSARPALNHHVGADPAERTLDEVAWIQSRVYAAALQLEFEGLRAELQDLRGHAADLAAAERDWQPLLRARGNLVLTNGLGTLATLPVDIARLIAQGRAVDVEVQAGPRSHQLLAGGQVVADLPRSLTPHLRRVLGAVDWDAQGPLVPVPGIPAPDGAPATAPGPANTGAAQGVQS